MEHRLQGPGIAGVGSDLAEGRAKQGAGPLGGHHEQDSWRRGRGWHAGGMSVAPAKRKPAVQPEVLTRTSGGSVTLRAAAFLFGLLVAAVSIIEAQTVTVRPEMGAQLTYW